MVELRFFRKNALGIFMDYFQGNYYEKWEIFIKISFVCQRIVGFCQNGGIRYALDVKDVKNGAHINAPFSTFVRFLQQYDIVLFAYAASFFVP